jgi:hypothetical protein
MVGSILTVHVVEARDLKAMDMDGTSDPYVELIIEGQKIVTNIKKSTLSPVWNESFTFDIQHGKEDLEVYVMDKDTFGNDFEGQCFISLTEELRRYGIQERLSDQMKHDLWFDLEEKNGQKGQGRIRLMLQWVYSKVQYFSEYLKKWDDTLEQDIQEKEIIEAYITQMESPFGFLD